MAEKRKRGRPPVGKKSRPVTITVRVDEDVKKKWVKKYGAKGGDVLRAFIDSKIK